MKKKCPKCQREHTLVETEEGVFTVLRCRICGWRKERMNKNLDIRKLRREVQNERNKHRVGR